MTQAAYLEDVNLVERCLGRVSGAQEAAARDLFRRYRGRVHAALFRILGGNADMEDLLQETFVQVFASLKSWRAEASLATWIDRIAVRVAYRAIGRRRARPEHLALDGETPEVVVATDGPAAVLAKDGVRRLYAALDRLPPAARVAFALHEIDGRSMAEVAEVTNATVTATKLRVWRARRTLEAAAARDPVLREFLRDDGGAR
ncbi:MAG: RNA polymerase sigma factor [Myxococcales bacterium]|nr:RNA polymerase sigma factor [Myxococcales bacterium]